MKESQLYYLTAIVVMVPHIPAQGAGVLALISLAGWAVNKYLEHLRK